MPQRAHPPPKAPSLPPSKLTDLPAQTAKTLNYLDSSLTIPYFTFFVFVWIYLRHYINLVIILAVGLPTGAFRTIGPFQLDWDTQQYKCWISQGITFGLLYYLESATRNAGTKGGLIEDG